MNFAELIKFENTLNFDGELSCELNISEKIPTFEGHFPGNPVLPAITVIEISRHFLRSQGIEFSESQLSLDKSKFMDMIVPNQRVQIVAKLSERKKWEVVWRSVESGGRLALLNINP